MDTAKRVGGVAGRHVKDPRCLGCCHGMGQPKEKRETEKLRKKPAARLGGVEGKLP